MYAFYWNSKKVQICDNTDASGGFEIKVSGKTEARAIAEKHSAKCWNF
jgi:hypothetical protein